MSLPATTVLLIDDEPAQQRLVSAIVARSGWRTIFATSAEMAIAILGTRDGMLLDAVLLDHSIPGSDSNALIAEIRLRRPALPVLMLTALHSESIAADALRAGATDFLVKPITPERLLSALDATINADAPKRELRSLSEKSSLQLDFGEIVGSDPVFRTSLAIAAKAARARLPILIEGEYGVGKALIANAIHAASPRMKKPLTMINCAEIPGNLIESILFGHERGAFAGAFAPHIGKFADADGGTLVLDGIEALSLDAQEKLLRVINSGEIYPIGSRGFREVDVRLIITTNLNLLDAVMAGRFREDLFYRLAIVHVTVPPLRERTADMPALVRHLLARIAKQIAMPRLGISDDALNVLAVYRWPGNVCQLHDVLYRAAIDCTRDTLTPSDFPEISGINGEQFFGKRLVNEAGVMLYEADGHLRTLEAIEADVIRLAIGHYHGRMTEVARRLNIGRSTLYRKLAELGISDAA